MLYVNRTHTSALKIDADTRLTARLHGAYLAAITPTVGLHEANEYSDSNRRPNHR